MAGPQSVKRRIVAGEYAPRSHIFALGRNFHRVVNAGHGWQRRPYKTRPLSPYIHSQQETLVLMRVRCHPHAVRCNSKEQKGLLTATVCTRHQRHHMAMYVCTRASLNAGLPLRNRFPSTSVALASVPHCTVESPSIHPSIHPSVVAMYL